YRRKQAELLRRLVCRLAEGVAHRPGRPGRRNVRRLFSQDYAVYVEGRKISRRAALDRTSDLAGTSQGCSGHWNCCNTGMAVGADLWRWRAGAFAGSAVVAQLDEGADQGRPAGVGSDHVRR